MSDGESLNESLNTREKEVLSLMQHKSVEETTNEEDTDEASFEGVEKEEEGKDSVSVNMKKDGDEEGKDSNDKEVNDKPAGDGKENDQSGGVNEGKDKADGDGQEKDGSEEALYDLSITEEAVSNPIE